MLKLYVKTKMAVQSIKQNIEGASLVEYALLIGLISVALVTIVGLLATAIGVSFTGATDAITPAAAPAG